MRQPTIYVLFTLLIGQSDALQCNVMNTIQGIFVQQCPAEQIYKGCNDPGNPAVACQTLQVRESATKNLLRKKHKNDIEVKAWIVFEHITNHYKPIVSNKEESVNVTLVIMNSAMDHLASLS
uniref:SCY domain-containing protein n=1 Tax=Heterorhabditis bacteriophora TaxID=37862 RepID=A0A1I7XKQ8_HETBA